MMGDMRIPWGISRFPDIILGPSMLPPDAKTRSDMKRKLTKDSGIRRKKAAAVKWPHRN